MGDLANRLHGPEAGQLLGVEASIALRPEAMEADLPALEVVDEAPGREVDLLPAGEEAAVKEPCELSRSLPVHIVGERLGVAFGMHQHHGAIEGLLIRVAAEHAAVLELQLLVLGAELAPQAADAEEIGNEVRRRCVDVDLALLVDHLRRGYDPARIPEADLALVLGIRVHGSIARQADRLGEADCYLIRGVKILLRRAAG